MNNPVTMNKEALRNHIRSLKRQLTSNQINQQSNVIANKLYQTQEYQEARVIYAYNSYNQEVITQGIIMRALESGKKVAVPKVETDEIVFYYIEGLQDIQLGYQGIYEPNTYQKAKDTDILMLMPGLAYDYKGNRMGYGGGFYDKYLKKYQPNISVKIGVAYDFQICEQLNVEQHDQKVDMIITTSNIIKCRDT